MSLSPSIPETKPPAKRPERKDTIEPEDIVIGEDAEEGNRGRRALRRPVRNTGNEGGGGVGTGLSA